MSSSKNVTTQKLSSAWKVALSSAMTCTSSTAHQILLHISAYRPSHTYRIQSKFQYYELHVSDADQVQTAQHTINNERVHTEGGWFRKENCPHDHPPPTRDESLSPLDSHPSQDSQYHRRASYWRAPLFCPTADVSIGAVYSSSPSLSLALMDTLLYRYKSKASLPIGFLLTHPHGTLRNYADRTMASLPGS